MSQLLIYQRVRPCANLLWSDLALVMLTSMVISTVGTGVFLSYLSLGAVCSGLVFYTEHTQAFLKRLSEKRS